MKLKKIASICGKSKRIFLYDVRGEGGTITQWIGDGNAAYPAFDLPYLAKENVFAVLDVPDKQREKYYFRHITETPQEINFADTDPTERGVSNPELSVIYDGRILKPLQTRNGITFIQGVYLSPLDDVQSVTFLYERAGTGGGTYIVAKAGFLISAIILPYNALDHHFVSDLEDLTAACRAALNRQHTPGAAIPDNQTGLFPKDTAAGGDGQ